MWICFCCSNVLLECRVWTGSESSADALLGMHGSCFVELNWLVMERMKLLGDSQAAALLAFVAVLLSSLVVCDYVWE